MHKILIVDDEQHARNLIAELLTDCLPDAQITQVHSPLAALELIGKKDYDLLFTDIRMPEMTGLEMMEEMKRMGKQPLTVLISAHGEFEYASKGIDFGVLKFLVKPLHKDLIKEVVCLYLEKQKQETPSKIIELNYAKGIYRIETQQIMVLKSTKRGSLDVYTSDDILKNVTLTLVQAFRLLPPNFTYIHRNCIVNYPAIKRINPKTRELFLLCKETEIIVTCSRENLGKIYKLLNINDFTPPEIY